MVLTEKDLDLLHGPIADVEAALRARGATVRGDHGAMRAALKMALGGLDEAEEIIAYRTPRC